MACSVSLLQQEDETEFVPFLAQLITDRDVQKHFDWLYRGNPHGDAKTWLARDANNRVVGCTSVFPRILSLAGNQILAAHGGDAYVAPEARRQGIAKQLHHGSIDDMRKLGIACNFGVAPVPVNFRAFLKVGAISPCNFYNFQLPLDATWLTQRLKPGILRSGIEVLLNPVVRLYFRRNGVNRPGKLGLKEVTRFDERLDALFDSIAPQFGICTKRDAAYLNWRFSDHPFKIYTLIEFHKGEDLVGIAVLDLQRSKSRIVDFFCLPDERVTRQCLRALIGYARKRTSGSLSLFLNPDGPYASDFRKLGFLKRPEELPIMALSAGNAEYDRYFEDGKQWFLTPADEDST